MIILLSCLGVPLHLPSSQQHSPRLFSKRICYWMVTSLGLFLFFLHLECHLISAALPASLGQTNDVKASTTIYEKMSSSAFVWNVLIDYTNTTILVLGSHITIMTCLLTNWCGVAKVLKRIEELSFYTDQDYKRFRNTSTGGLIASLIVCLPYWYYKFRGKL